MNAPRALLSAVALGAAMLASPVAQAQLFGGDDEARRAILELRQRVDAQRVQIEQQAAQQAELMRRANEETSQLRRSLLDLQAQIETLRGELAGLRGNDEQLARSVSDLQRLQKDLAVAIEERLRRFEPAQVSMDGRQFTAQPQEQQAFDAALATFRRGEFPQAQAAFSSFVQRYPQSGYYPAALFWLGNAQYGTRDCQGAIGNFRTMLQNAPDHPRAPEAVLSIANCQLELKDVPAARRTLEDLVTAYPGSEAANAARDRLARLPAAEPARADTRPTEQRRR
ncbi:tol-pal system protein YbgF [Ramlibacter rhizophilus]|uniref:Cell division coordinator CpoB n=1 Tax=Ramlibacter rhizophilus TaxID=1781167 RepID=A0A4Z0BZX2_9BURK|nr:tol-pal system protein YbgF [Ramlibacter rhizophilus]TFZ04846.1 tol-pal system protein YbgF [Ramlibacter rhizophilus]